MLSPQERVEQFKRIRAIEREAFPDEDTEILATKAVEAIIDVAIKQKTLTKPGWLEKYVRNTCQSTLDNRKEGSELKKKNANLPPGERLRSESFLTINLKPLKPVNSEHFIRLKISEMPEYQPIKDYYRIAVLLFDFECEAKVPRQEFEAFLKKTRSAAKFEAELRGTIVAETAKGFELRISQMQVLSAVKATGIVPARSQSISV
jgi:hypothetical protein